MLQLPAYTTVRAMVGSEACLQPTPELTAMPVPPPMSKSAIEPASSWTPVGFISAVPRKELLGHFSQNKNKKYLNLCRNPKDPKYHNNLEKEEQIWWNYTP